MIEQTWKLQDPEQISIHVYTWQPLEQVPIRGVVQIAHGMTETAKRYERFAASLAKEGYIVYANDHRGHGLTAKHPDELGYVGEDGFNWMVRNMGQLSEEIKRRHPGLPLFLFAHSMGSFLAQKYIYTFSRHIDGVILSGSNGPRGIELALGIAVTRTIMSIKGKKYRSKWVDSLEFGGFNKAFEPTKTPFDWLSRDEEEVEKYIADPYCGNLSTVSFYHDFFRLLRDIHKTESMSKIPKDLPIFVLAGEQDPVGNMGKGIQKLMKTYSRLGLQAESKLYPGARHEILNELNRDEVTIDVIDWLNRHT
ncbi:alpha/beta hydrolase [Paenibacillus larvae]